MTLKAEMEMLSQTDSAGQQVDRELGNGIGAVSAESRTAGGLRRSSRFDWNAVPEAVLVSILAQIDAQTPSRLRRLAQGELAAVVTGAFGIRPRLEWAGRDQFGLSLRDDWPKLLASDQLADMVWGLAGDSRWEEIGASRRAQLAWLGERNLTLPIRRGLLGEFRRQYRTRGEPTPIGSPGRRASGLAVLKGTASPSTIVPYAHQREAWRVLEKEMVLREGAPVRSGLIVLPTGSGKTETAVRWLVRSALCAPVGATVRVLWIAHQRELLDQARIAFERAVAELPEGVVVRARAFHGNAGSTTLLAEADLDLALVTNSTLGRKLDAVNKARLLAFLREPTVVVVDEAHHAGADTYQRILDIARSSGNLRGVLGLTATPWPTGARALARFRATFPETFIRRSYESLVAEGILARPVLHSVATGQIIRLTAEEIDDADRRQDLSPASRRRVDTTARNSLVADTWSRRQAIFKKTLVFAADRAHADRLGGAFAAVGADVRVLHGETLEDRSEVLSWFRSSASNVVLVSVNMLTEGVDLPDASTAILAAPTTSRIRLRQMIGRALRGPAAGGGVEAHICSFQDTWANFHDVLEPPDVLEADYEERIAERSGVDRVLPALSGLPGSAVAEASRQFAAAAERDLELRVEEGRANTVVDSPMVGYYDLEDRQVPVFAHQEQAWAQTIDRSASDMGASMLTAFADIPDPRPSRRTVEAVVAFCREEGPPRYLPLDPTTTPSAVAAALDDGVARTSLQRRLLQESLWEASLARRQYPDFGAFTAAVAEARRAERRLHEQPIAQSATRADLPTMPPAARDLEAALQRVLDRAAGPLDLPSNLVERLRRPPVRIAWSQQPMRSLLAYWTAGVRRGPGAPRIVVNCLYQTDQAVVSNEMLDYLIWHEVVHHLLPLHGHDPLFRTFEHRWPEAVDLDAQWDGLGDRYQLDLGATGH